MSQHWVPLTTSNLSEIEEDYFNTILNTLNCPHQETVRILFLDGHHRNEIFRITCNHCNKDTLIKKFSSGGQYFFPEKVNIERFNQIVLSDKALTQQFLSPTTIASIEKPHYSIIKEFVNYSPFLSYITKHIKNGVNGVNELLKPVSSFGKMLATFHTMTIGSSHDKNLSYIDERDNIADCIGLSHNHVNQLQTLAKEWLNNLFFQKNLKSCVIHEEPTPYNILFSPGNGEFVLTDFETMKDATPFIDIGTFSAELKYAFYVHAWDERLAEPFISCFLQSYFVKQDFLDIGYNDFTWMQAYFMGKRFLKISAGRWLEPKTKEWCIETAGDIWNLISYDNRIKPKNKKFKNVEAVFFDFYNTLVEVKDIEGRLSNFAHIIDFINKNSNTRKLPLTATQLRELYYSEIKYLYAANSEKYPEINIENVWGNILINTPEDYLYFLDQYQDQKAFLKKIMLKFREASLIYLQVFPEVKALLQAIRGKGIKTGIISDAQPVYFETEFDRFSLSGMIDCIVLSGDYHFRKPSGELFQIALDKLNVRAESSLYVGDDIFRDIFGAQKAGMQTIYKPSPFGSEFYFKTVPDAIIKRIEEIDDMIH